MIFPKVTGSKVLLQRLLMLLLLSVIEGCDNNGQEIILNPSAEHLQKLRIEGVDLSPAYEIAQKHYVSTAAFSATKINLQAWTKFPDDSVAVNGKLLDELDEYNLAVGNNQFNIIVTTENGEQEQYQLTITRLTKIASNN